MILKQKTGQKRALTIRRVVRRTPRRYATAFILCLLILTHLRLEHLLKADLLYMIKLLILRY